MNAWLDLDELRSAVQLGGERRIQALMRQRRGAHGFDREEVWDIDIEGLAAEMAAAKALGLDYSPVVGRLDTSEGDIAPGLQVRSTKYDTGHLLVHESDADGDIFILVIGRAPYFRLAGWAYGHAGKRPEYWRVHRGRGAYWMPQADLRPMHTLEV